jgi:hypothetical protein
MNRRSLMFGFAALGLLTLLGGRSEALHVSVKGSTPKPSCCCCGARAETTPAKLACDCCGPACCCGDACACGDSCCCGTCECDAG